MEFVRTQLIFNPEAGARENTRKIIVVITDGRSNLGLDPIIPAGKLKENFNITISALSITNKINETELQGIASSPSHVLHLKDFAALKNFTDRLKDGKGNLVNKNVGSAFSVIRGLNHNQLLSSSQNMPYNYIF